MSFLSQPLQNIFFGPSRKFGTVNNGFSAFVTINENTTDALEITQQPVQQGSTISDHAFKKPVTFSMQALWSDNDPGNGTLAEIYKSLVELQLSREPFDIVTPKRVYTNMLISSLGQTTDKKTENCLAITASFQEVIIVNVSTTQVPRSKQRNPALTSKTENAGKKSILKTLSNAVTGRG